MRPGAFFAAMALVGGMLATPGAKAIEGIDWLDTLPLHMTAISSCQQRLPYPSLIVVDLRPDISDAEIDFRTDHTLYTCQVGVYGGEPSIRDASVDTPLPERFFTLLPAYPEYDCYQHKLIQNYHLDPPEAIGWISNRIC